MDTGNKTLDLFWRAMKACNISERDAQKILRRIEEKNNYRISELRRTTGTKTRTIVSESEIKLGRRSDYNQTVVLSPKLIEFLKEVRQRSTKKMMPANSGISITTYYTAIKTGKVSIQSYERIVEAKERWEALKNKTKGEKSLL